MADHALTTAQPDALSSMLGFRTISITELTDEQKRVLKDSVAKDTTDTELAYFLNVAMAQELNPFNKEVWCIKMGGRVVIQTARDGFLKIAKRDPTFDYIQSAEVRDGDDFRMDAITGQIEHRITAKRGAILGAWAIITRKDGVKIAKYVTYTEYFDPSSSMWKDYPTAMITKCVESVLCKQFANVTGILAEETMHKDNVTVDSSPAAADKSSTLKQKLLDQISACKTIAELDTLAQELSASVGKLFTHERDEVMAAGKKRRQELSAVDAEIVASDEIGPSGEPTEHPQNATEMPQDEFIAFLEGLSAHDTLIGLSDLYDVATAKPMSEEQKMSFAEKFLTCKEELAPKPSIRKAFKDGAKKASSSAA